jgi:hypothetical protein
MGRFDVVGDYDLSGDDLQGDVMGDDFQTSGDVMGDEVVGIVKRNKRTGRNVIQRVPQGRAIRIPPKPQWRNQLAPGVIQPDEGMVPLPLKADTNGGIFTAAFTNMVFQGQLQKPYRPERLLVSVVRTGASAVGRLMGQIFVGTDLQQAEIDPFDLELVGQAASFGTRLTCLAAEPGVLVRLQVIIMPAPTGSDTVFATMMWLGRIIH